MGISDFLAVISQSCKKPELVDRTDRIQVAGYALTQNKPPHPFTPETVNLSCEDSGARAGQVHVNLTDRLRILRIKWKFFPSLQPRPRTPARDSLTSAAEGIATRAPPNLPDPDLRNRATTTPPPLPSLPPITLPPGYGVRIQITSRLHFGGNFSLARTCTHKGILAYCEGYRQDTQINLPVRRIKTAERVKLIITEGLAEFLT
ncbi:unnamed protein product [Dibothriocephalus latus]|uniref:Uncharacterized protein n=1 Tax=Dibothriocephalus latus TaxID=60516 RepID=A0A3P6S6P2_DIBLA|nr:unnamed protein product [Dibothriocephalus latus]